MVIHVAKPVASVMRSSGTFCQPSQYFIRSSRWGSVKYTLTSSGSGAMSNLKMYSHQGSKWAKVHMIVARTIVKGCFLSIL